MQIQISWLLQKPTDLNLHCLQKQGTTGLSRTGVKSASARPTTYRQCHAKKCLAFLCEQWRPRSAWASMQSDQGLHCLLTESLDTTECMKGEQKPRWYFFMPRMIWICKFCACWKALFFFDAAHMFSWRNKKKIFIGYPLLSGAVLPPFSLETSLKGKNFLPVGGSSCL